ncbi:MAG: ABC transporter ATP-binding protein [Gemmatimonadales bacterium]
MIAAHGLTRVFGSRVAVENVSFEVPAGSLCALLGPNGAGKTTVIRMLLGLIGPTRGTATVAGLDLPASSETGARIRARCGLLTETPGFYDRLSARENLALFGRLYGFQAERSPEVARLLEEFGLAPRRDDAVGTYSKGMKQRLAIIRAVFHNPDVIFLDEPTSGLDPESAVQVRGLIRSLKASGRTMIVCTHNLTEAAELADVVGVLKGTIRAFGRPEALGAGTSRLRIVTDRPDDCERIAAGLGHRPVRTGGAVELETADPDRAAPALVAALVGAGVGVREIRPIGPSLEEIYLGAVREAER